MFLAAVQSAQKQSKEQLQSSAAVTEVPSEVVGPPPPPACLAPLLKHVAQQGLRTLGMHPLFLRHAFLELSAVNKQVDDISVLKDFVNLMYVDVSNNTIKTLKPLEGIPALVQLRARGNMLTECLDFRPALCSEEESWSTGHQAVGSMLTLADLRENQISCLHELADHFFLECLLLANNQISVIKGISKLRYLQTLDLSHNRLAIIEGLDHLPIRELNLSHNNILSLDGLSTMPCLSALNVSNNNIVTLAPLRANDTLTYVDASDNEIGQIRQVEFLAELPWVQWLSMQGNPCYKKPHYRLRIIYRMANLQMLDQVAVSYEEKVVYTLYLNNHCC